MPESEPTEKALELRKKPIKEIFDCVELADREVTRFKEWFKENYSYSWEKAPKEELATAIYSYTARQKRSIFGVLGIPGKEGFEIQPRTEELKAKSQRFFGNSNTMLKDILETREGQCVAFTSLYCMLAEELGVNVKPFVVTKWEDGTPLVGENGHVVPAFIMKSGRTILFDSANWVPNAKYKGAVKEKEELLVSALYNKGTSLAKLGKYEEAIVYFDKALEINPDNVEALNNTGVALAKLGKYKEAIECYDKALKLAPGDSDILKNRALASPASDKQPKKEKAKA